MGTSWRSSNYYGRSTRTTFKKLQRMIIKEFDAAEKDGSQVPVERVDKLTKLIGKSHNCIHVIVKIVDVIDMHDRMADLEDIITNVEPSALADAKAKWESQKQYR